MSSKPTYSQIIAEANRRYQRNETPAFYEHHIIDVVREGWTPPEPVDPDLLAFREWEARRPCPDYFRKEVLAGKRDTTPYAEAYLAGARMAREQEQEGGNRVENAQCHGAHRRSPL